jgi:hypothetical protein
MISARPSYQGVRRSVWDPETFAQGFRVYGLVLIKFKRTDGGLSPLVSAKACHMVKRRVGL